MSTMQSDYDRSPLAGKSSPGIERVVIRGRTYDFAKIHGEWIDRKTKAEKHREQFLPQIRINRKFAAGKQHLNVSTRTGRVLDVRERNGMKLVTSDVLSQYILTVLGRMGSKDYRQNFLASTDSEMASQIAEHMNDSYGWGWDNEWMGDRKVSNLFNLLVTDGTCALRVRYDRMKGDLVGDMPHVDGVPILDPTEMYDHVQSMLDEGKAADIRPVREGKVTWELLSFDNLLTPPGYEDDYEFPWDIIVRPVLVKDIKARYGKLAENTKSQEIESTAALTAGLGFTDDKVTKLEDCAFVYTGYDRPCPEYPTGMTVVFTDEAILDIIEDLPFPDHPKGPRTGLHYFRWQIVPGRFPGKAFIENGIGPQQIRNKRLTQIDAIIDRNLPKVFVEEQSLSRPKTGEPFEVIEVRAGSPLPQVQAGVQPGTWMLDDVKLQDENVERALGMRSISLGAPPAGVSAYSAMALLTENDSLKLDPISQAVDLEMVQVAWDTMEAMRNWPKSKQISIAGPDNQLRTFFFDHSKVPYDYMVRQPRGGSLPRTQAAELQKVNDIWNASMAARMPLPLEWYVTSLNAGKAQPLPPSLANTDEHIAELENYMMLSTGEVPPVAPYHNHEKHVELHREQQEQMQMLADQGDQAAEQLVQIFEQHIQEHLQAAQQNASGAQGAPTAGAPAPGNPPMSSPQTPGAPSPTPGGGGILGALASQGGAPQ